MLLSVLFSLVFMHAVGAFTLYGQIELPEGAGGFTRYMIPRNQIRIYELNTSTPYSANTYVHDAQGHFAFRDVPINQGVNATTKFAVYPSSMDFNLRPVRMLVEVRDCGNGTIDVQAFMNIFAREYWAPENATNADTLIHVKPIKAPKTYNDVAAQDQEKENADFSTEMPWITLRFGVISQEPLRKYLQQRNVGILNSGIVGNILSSRWKTAGVVTMLALFLVPQVIARLDPDTMKALKQDEREKIRAKYTVTAAK